MTKIVTLGEIMLRLSPAGNYRFVQADSFDVVSVEEVEALCGGDASGRVQR